MDEEHVNKLFAYAHLPPHLQTISKPFHDLAFVLLAETQVSAEQTVALRELVQAKDAAVRALVMHTKA